MRSRYDAVIVGGGHNGLVAAAYLARAGRSVLVLERREHPGGAAVSERPWPGVDPRDAFAGTFHVNESARQLAAAHARASAGRLPDPVTCEVYCHTLADP